MEKISDESLNREIFGGLMKETASIRIVNGYRIYKSLNYEYKINNDDK